MGASNGRGSVAADGIDVAADEIDAPQHPPEPRSAVGTERRVMSGGALAVLMFVLYLVIGSFAFWPAYPGISTHLFSNEQDFTQTIWFLDWVPHALAHGLNPFFSNWLYVPTGVNLAQNTSTPLLGWLTAPLAPLLSPVVRTNLMMVLAMPLSATAGFVVLRKWGLWGPAAALGGLAYGFSPYMVSQSVAHLGLIFVPLPPFIALTVASIVQGRGSPRRLGVQLGLLVVAQFLISPEILATVALLTVVALAYVAIRDRGQVTTAMRSASRAVIIAGGVVIVALAYPFWMMSYGPQHFTGPPGSTINPYHSDVLSFVLPTAHQRLSFGMRSLGSRFISTTAEGDGYIGIPVLLATVFLVWRSRRSRRMQLATVLLLVAGVLSLGPHLSIDGRLTTIPLPFLGLDHLPLLSGLLPGRISFEVGACIAAILAFGVDDARQGVVGTRTGSRRGVVLGVVILAVVVATQLPVWPGSYSAERAAALPPALSRAIPSGDPVAITFPYDTFNNNAPMLWQAETDFKFRLLGGYAYHVYQGQNYPSLLPNPMSPPDLQRFLADESEVNTTVFGALRPVSPTLVAATRSAAARYGIRVVIVDRSASHSGPAVELFDDAFGPPAVSSGHFSMWTGWHGRPSHQDFGHDLTAVVHPPVHEASSPGTVALVGTGSGYYPITRVQFLLTNDLHQTTVIATGVPSYFGWLAKWRTSSVPAGTYALQSRVIRRVRCTRAQQEYPDHDRGWRAVVVYVTPRPRPRRAGEPRGG